MAEEHRIGALVSHHKGDFLFWITIALAAGVMGSLWLPVPSAITALIADHFMLIITALMILLISAVFLQFEEKSIDSRQITAIGALAAIAIVLRIPFGMLPGVQPRRRLAARGGRRLWRL